LKNKHNIMRHGTKYNITLIYLEQMLQKFLLNHIWGCACCILKLPLDTLYPLSFLNTWRQDCQS
jgi:hypothetical protein